MDEGRGSVRLRLGSVRTGDEGETLARETKMKKGYMAIHFTGNFQVRHFKIIFPPWNL